MQTIYPKVLVDGICATGIICVWVVPFTSISWAKTRGVFDRTRLWVRAYIIKQFIVQLMGVKQEDCSIRSVVAEIRQCLRKVGVVSFDEAAELLLALGVVPPRVWRSL